METWCAVDGNGEEFLFNHCPVRNDGKGKFWRCKETPNKTIIGSLHFIQVPSGTIEFLLGYIITWENEAVQLGEEESEEVKYSRHDNEDKEEDWGF